MAETRCQGCGKPLTAARDGQRHHNATCRSRAYRARKAAAAPRPALAPAPTPQPSELDALLERALDEPRLVARVASLATTGPPTVSLRALTWLLERKYAERWAPRQRVVVSEAGDDVDPAVEAQVQRLLSVVPDDAG